MKITHIASNISSGAGIGMMRYHQSLLKIGLDSRVIVAPSSTFRTRVEIEKISRTYPSTLESLGSRVGFALSAEAKMRQQLERLDQTGGSLSQYELFSLPFSNFRPEVHPWVQEADIINLHWVAGVLDWSRFFNSVNEPIVLTLHDQQPYLGGFHYALDAELNPHLAPLEAEVRAIKQSALSGHRVAVIANSDWNAKEARRSGFFETETPIETIYYPLDTQVFQPRPKAAAKTTFGIDPAQKVIGFACENLSNTRKGFTDLVEALALLPDSLRTHITLLSFGRDPSSALRDRICLPWVHLGFLNSEIAQVAAYSAMDVFVIPSRAEAFGQTALEAIACGVQVIGSDVGGIADALSNSPHSLLYPNGQVKDLAERIQQAVTRNEPMKGEEGKCDRLLARHSTSACAQAHLRLYKHLIAP